MDTLGQLKPHFSHSCLLQVQGSTAWSSTLRAPMLPCGWSLGTTAPSGELLWHSRLLTTREPAGIHWELLRVVLGVMLTHSCCRAACKLRRQALPMCTCAIHSAMERFRALLMLISQFHHRRNRRWRMCIMYEKV